MHERPGCGDTRELLPELAAGVAAGDDRARALRHLSGCAACRGELDALAIVADEMVAWAPAVEPPAGFESAVLARLGPRPGRWSPRRSPRMVTAVGVAAAVGALAGAATVLRGHRRGRPPRRFVPSGGAGRRRPTAGRAPAARMPPRPPRRSSPTSLDPCRHPDPELRRVVEVRVGLVGYGYAENFA
jgi:Putative zinc-finger